MPSSLVTCQHAPSSTVLDLVRALAARADFDRVTAFYAHATAAGVQLLLGTMARVPGMWRRARKRWLLSIDNGVTEPEALAMLLSTPRSEVRIHDAEEVLKRQLRPRTSFHVKSMVFDTHDHASLGPAAMLVGSANLTFSGLCLGHEHAMALLWRDQKTSGDPGDAVREAVARMERVYLSSPALDSRLIKRYASVRPARPPRTEDTGNTDVDRLSQPNPSLPLDVAVTLASGTNFWIQIKYVVENRGPGEEGNQIDLQKGSRFFFGFASKEVSKNTPLGVVPIRYGNNVVTRNMRFGDNSMDKLDLPIPNVEGPQTYTNATLLFTKLPDGTYQMKVGSSA